MASTLAYAYLRACDAEGIDEDGWTFDALLAAGGQGADPPPPVLPAPAATWAENDARRRAVEATIEFARAKGIEVPEDVTVRLLQWIHDVKGWNA
ncbi:hypothetical protein [Lichenifustis flavocetrariae]|uniref:Uncharacterized protein n=1 Tax=Lichenifustis flavocetrariae TaxID=2949735 RepID=A0AA42CIN6_9HYPH|nr:hypothetical protein [Lichenifustis flavocetrariae]MCW6507066.1 hypothetical protein [Lichenifustis flavocetrariae]